MRTGKEACGGFRIATYKLETEILEFIAERLFTEDRCKLILKDLVDQSGPFASRRTSTVAGWRASGEVPGDVGLDRVRELRATRDELRQTLPTIVPLRPPHRACSASTPSRAFRMQSELRS